MRMIRNLTDLCAYFGADSPSSLNRRLYKDTDCGASISVRRTEAPQCAKCAAYFERFSCGASVGTGECDCPKCQGYCRCDAWVHNGSKAWSELTDANTDAFTIQTIVEGSEATVDSGTFSFPVAAAKVEAWEDEMEAQASELWREANEVNR